MKLSTLSYLLTLFVPALATAGTSFDDAVAEIMANNLSPRIESARSRAQIEQMFGENTLESPEVEFTRLWGAEGVGNKWSLSVSQSFDWPGIYAARRQAARNASTASQFAMESTLLDLRLEVRSALIDLIHNKQLVEMQSDRVKHLSELEETFRKGVESGSETRLDYNKTVIELIAAKKELQSIEAESARLLATLSELNGGADITGILSKLGNTYPIIPAIDPENISLETIKQRDPSYAAALATAEAAKSMSKVEKMASLPGFSLGFEHETEVDEHFNGFSVGISLPVWGRRHQRKAASLEADVAVMEAEMALVKRTTELTADLYRMKSLKRTLDEYEPVVNDKANINLLKKAYDAGQINFITYVQELNYFIEARRDYLDTLYEYSLALTRLTRYE